MTTLANISEIWKDILGYEGRYQVSSTGRIKALSRVYNNPKNNRAKKKEKFLKLLLVKRGYLSVVLYNENSEIKRHLVHRIVAKTFIPNPENKKTVNHKNGVKSDNSVENLEWNTNLENIRHSYSSGIREIRFGEESNAAKLTQKQVVEIREMLNNGLKLCDIADQFKVSATAIGWINSNRTWHDPKFKPVNTKNRSYRKLTSHDIPIIRDAIKHGYSNSKIARYFKVTRECIRKIKIKKTWTWQ